MSFPNSTFHICLLGTFPCIKEFETLILTLCGLLAHDLREHIYLGSAPCSQVMPFDCARENLGPAPLQLPQKLNLLHLINPRVNGTSLISALEEH